MPLKIRRVLAEVSYPERPGTTITLRDQATQAVLGSTTLDGAGLGTVLLPFELYLAAVAGGHAGAGAALAAPGQETGGAGGAAGGSGTLTQTLPIAGSAAGHAGGAASETTGIAGAAAGHAAGVATPSTLDPNQQGGGAGGAGGGSGSLVVSAPLVGGAGGHAAAGAGGIGQELPIAAGAGGQAAATSTATVTSATIPAAAQSIVIAGASLAAQESTSSYAGTNGTVSVDAISFGAYNDGKSTVYYTVGLITPALNPGGSIESFKIKFNCATSTGLAPSQVAIDIKVLASLNPAAWSASNKPSLATVTATTVQWTTPATAPALKEWFTTPELLPLLAAAGWSSGGAIGLVFRLRSQPASTAYSLTAYSPTYSDAAYRPVILINGAT